MALTGLSAGANIAAGAVESRQTSKASNRLQEGGREAISLLGDVYGQQRSDLSPYVQAGQGGMMRASQLANLNPQDINAMAFMDPGYKFRLSEGLQGVERSSLAKGNFLSGGTAKALNNYAQGAASQEYANAFNRAFSLSNEQFDRATQVGQMGLQATGQQVAAGGQYGNQVAGLTTDIASAGAAGSVQQGNIWSDVIGGVANTIGGAVSAGRGGGTSSYGTQPGQTNPMTNTPMLPPA
jgi:hypothetical protein